MAINDYQIKVLNSLALYEESLNRLYMLYADAFKEHSDFWNSIANDETYHATWLRSFYHRAQKDEVFFTEGRFDLNNIQSSLDDLSGLIKDAEEGTVESGEAFKIALRLETTPMEREYYAVMHSDMPEFQQLLQKLYHANELHMKKLEDYIRLKQI